VDEKCFLGVQLYFPPVGIRFRQILKKWEYNEAVYQLFVDFKKDYDSVRREDLYNILNELKYPHETGRLIKMCLNEIYSTVRAGKRLSSMFRIRDGLKQRIALSPLLLNFASKYTIKRFG
jgi:hypothetical protein